MERFSPAAWLSSKGNKTRAHRPVRRQTRRCAGSSGVPVCLLSALAALLALSAIRSAHAQEPPAPAEADSVLRVCADADNLPQSNERGEGFENKIAQALARDLGRRVEYTFFPQRMGFVRNTLRARDPTSQQFKCDVIIGVPKGYELTATTQPYLHSTYALIYPAGAKLPRLDSPEALLKLSPKKRGALRFGVFARSPGADWLLRNGMVDQAAFYAQQSGDPHENPASIIERDLAAGKIDAAILWGPVAGFLVQRHSGSEEWVAVPFPPDPQIRFDYEISMGVRFGEQEWKDTLDGWIAAHRDEINGILKDYRIPLLEGNVKAAAPDRAP